jgi:peptidoglycan biosynthesis protein MviN/MurJ (putative lipid II flippase)
LSLGYSVVQARLLGTSDEIEVFLPPIVRHLWLVRSLRRGSLVKYSYSLPSAFGQARLSIARKAFSVVVNRMVVVVTVLLVVVSLLTPPLIVLIVPGFSSETQELTITMFRIILFFILLDIINSFINTILNAENIFGRAELTGIFRASLSLLFLWVLFRILVSGPSLSPSLLEK